MRLKKIFGDNVSVDVAPTEDYMEVGVMDPDKATGRIRISIEKMDDFADTDRVLRALRKGNIVFLKIKGLKEKDMSELKRAVERLKKTTIANNGDIAGVETDWLIITPQYATVEREG